MPRQPSDQLHDVQDEMRTRIARAVGWVSRPGERRLGCLFPRSAQQPATQVFALAWERSYLVSVSSMSGEVACIYMPRAGYRSVNFCFINQAMVR
jgi:hypothetical protein